MSLALSWTLGALRLDATPYLVGFGTEYQDADTTEDVLASLLSDGDLEVSSRRGNRTITLPVLIEGTLSQIAAAEAALAAEAEKGQNVLTVEQGDGVAPSMQFKLTRKTKITWNRDDEYERSGFRSYTLTMRALPFPQSTTETVIAPFTPPVSVTTVTVDDGTSTTGWTSSPGSPSTSGGAVRATSTLGVGGVSPTVLSLTRTGSIATSATQYIGIDCLMTLDGLPGTPTVLLDGVVTASVTSVVLGSGYRRVWVQAPGSSVNTVTVRMSVAFGGAPPAKSMTLAVDQIQRSNSYSAVSTTKQLQRTLTIAGSAPGVGSVAIEHETSALGDVLLYTNPTAYSPALRSLRTSGPSTPTTDATSVSGAYDTISGATPVVCTVPYSGLVDGEYLVMARVQTSTTLTMTVTAATVSGSTSVASEARSISLGTLAAWTFVRVGMIHLPVMDAGPSTSQTFTVTRSTGTLSLDELYLFNLTTGRLSQLACGTASPSAGGASNRVWVESPSVDNEGLGRLLRGYAADQSDAYSAYPTAASPAVHEFIPPEVMAFTVTTNADSAAISFSHNAAWIHTAAS